MDWDDEYIWPTMDRRLVQARLQRVKTPLTAQFAKDLKAGAALFNAIPTSGDKSRKTDMQTLYTFNDGETLRYGNRIGINTKGLWVMEERGTNAIFTIDGEKAEEVMPYTVSVVFASSDIGGRKPYAFFALEGQVAVGDLLLLPDFDYQIGVVTAVNTKERRAQKPLNGYKLNVTPIKGPE